MKKVYFLLIILGSLFTTTTFAQVIIHGGIGGGYYGGGGYYHGGGYGRVRRQGNNRRREPPFQPVVHVSVGYGFPNVDAYQFSDGYYTGLYKGNVTQTGPVTGAIDYQYNRYNSIGVMAMYGKLGIPYYDGNNNYQGSVNLENWSVMLNIMQYAPLSNSATLYFREALGANINNVSYTGNISSFQPNSFAYQVGVGAKFKMTDNVSFFAEAGYGKYILNGGLSFAFK